MWRDMLAAHQAGKIRATEVRASDYIEANSIFSFVLAKPLLAGKRSWVPAKLDVPHSWTSVSDVATTLVTAATTERAWGRGWLVPTNPPLTVRQMATRFTELNKAPAPKLTPLPYPALWAAGLFDVTVKELRHTYYQWDRPFTIDSRRRPGYSWRGTPAGAGDSPHSWASAAGPSGAGMNGFVLLAGDARPSSRRADHRSGGWPVPGRGRELAAGAAVAPGN